MPQGREDGVYRASVEGRRRGAGGAGRKKRGVGGSAAAARVQKNRCAPACPPLSLFLAFSLFSHVTRPLLNFYSRSFGIPLSTR